MESAAVPVVSVVVPVHNEAQHLGDQLAALAAQTFDAPWEVIVVDNGSSDASPDIVRDFQTRMPNLRLDHAPTAKGAGEARNHGVARSRASMLAFVDGDDVVDRGWLAAIVDGLRQHDVVTGHNDLVRLNPPHIRSYAETIRRARRVGGVSVVAGGNFGVRRAVWEALGGLTDDLGIGEDVDFGVRAHTAGMTVEYIDDAIVYRRLPDTAVGVFRQHRGYGRAQVLVRDRHASILGPGTIGRSAVRDAASILLRVPWMLDREKRFRYAMVAGRLTGRANAMLQPGARARARNPSRAPDFSPRQFPADADVDQNSR